MTIPIVFIHKGYSEYMEYSLRQAKASNPGSRIILLGNESNNRFDFVDHVDMDNYFSKAVEFAEIYRHLSTNPYQYELFCIQRWFILNKYMAENGMEKCFVCDTDVMIYSDIDEALKPFEKADLALVIQNQDYALSISLLPFKALEDFCSFITNLYNDKQAVEKLNIYYKNVIARKNLGGVSDMTLAANWLNQAAYKNVMTLIKDKNNSVFDNHIGLPFLEEDCSYKYKFGHKQIIWKKNFPYCFSIKHQRYMRFHILHFQGPAKYLMARYYNGNYFSARTYLDIKFLLSCFIAYIYITLKIRYRFAWLFRIIFKENDKHL
ncbi:hypothetical protein P0136_10270 [Lentisphaerota bacterium ZTH]|nr:hypothetical protein JYG24_12220 [Lentisphaerota bacterium]WET05745.1 hypothetical protein P0136_10270 [Lentisphaerota bacterium ZTH]